MNKTPNLIGIVSKILTFSCVDGPGNRLVIFLQGCNFNCKNCHNPHTISHCNHGGECVSSCPANALSKENNIVKWQPELCDQCDLCLTACPINANPMTKSYPVSEIITLLHKNNAFLSGVKSGCL